MPSNLKFKTPFGTIRAGHTSVLVSGVNGEIFANQTNPFGIVYKEASAVNVFINASKRVDNLVRYESPSLAGLRLYTSYSNGMTGDDSVGNSQKDRYAALGATYRKGPFRSAVVIDRTLWNNSVSGKSGYDDTQTYSLSATYDFGSATLHGGFQHGSNLAPAFSLQTFGTVASTPPWQVPVLMCSVGRLMTSVAYLRGDSDLNSKKEKTEMDAYQVGLGYRYTLSKRTFVYSAAAYRHTEFDSSKNSREKNRSRSRLSTFYCIGLVRFSASASSRLR